MSFPKYEKYKDSGVEWLGEVPAHWEILNGRRVFRNRSEIALGEDIQLAASQKYGIIPQSLMMELNNSKVMLALKGTESFRHVEKNDFVISLRSFEGGIEYSNYAGCVSPAYTVLALIKDNDPNFYRYSLKSKGFIAALQSTTDSLRDGKSITYQQFCDIPLVIPTKTEQQDIALFLDRETAKINELVAEQQQLIELLKEKRQAAISHAVTRGLNPNVKLKPSGIEWIGDVPEHWEIKRLKYNLKLLNEKTGEQTNPVALENIESWTGRFIETETKFEGEGIKFKVGDILFGKLRPYLAKVYCAEFSGEAIGDFLVMRPFKEVNSYFAQYQILNRDFISIVDGSTFGSRMPRASWEFVGGIVITKPPILEQEEIVLFLDQESAKFDTLTAEAQHAIDLFQERRTALISAAVTGKIDVRQLNKN